MSEDKGMMIEDVEVRHDGCMCEPCSDISPNWMNMRSEFGNITLAEMCPQIIDHMRGCHEHH